MGEAPNLGEGEGKPLALGEGVEEGEREGPRPEGEGEGVDEGVGWVEAVPLLISPSEAEVEGVDLADDVDEREGGRVGVVVVEGKGSVGVLTALGVCPRALEVEGERVDEEEGEVREVMEGLAGKVVEGEGVSRDVGEAVRFAVEDALRGVRVVLSVGLGVRVPKRGAALDVGVDSSVAAPLGWEEGEGFSVPVAPPTRAREGERVGLAVGVEERVGLGDWEGVGAEDRVAFEAVERGEGVDV